MKAAVLLAAFGLANVCSAGNPANFSVPAYIPINVVAGFDNAQKLADDWNGIQRQLKAGNNFTLGSAPTVGKVKWTVHQN